MTEHEPDWKPGASIAAMRLRARLNLLVREFFAVRDVLEVETPILSAAGNTTPNIDSFSSHFSGHVDAGSSERWLRTSPEHALKRLLAAGVGDCYELGRVFRNGEAGGRHNPEFTMLEWYRIGWDHLRLIGETAELVRAALGLVGRDASLEVVTYRELYQRELAIDPLLADIDTLCNALGDVHIDPQGLERDDWLDLLMTHRLQPAFSPDRMIAVHDWPASQAALARIRADDPPVAERFELYLGPVELANGYNELLAADEQRHRFDADISVRVRRGQALPAIDTRFIVALRHGMPACAGVALGVDRLLMVLHGSDHIGDVVAFDFSRA
ncbi:MAG: EF-P lysine aminoacylase GenX [Proteobacteria bacterium]|nr:EF-P lysine aminoacylase GenX [Pseudomonadota bacterium]